MALNGKGNRKNNREVSEGRESGMQSDEHDEFPHCDSKTSNCCFYLVILMLSGLLVIDCSLKLTETMQTVPPPHTHTYSLKTLHCFTLALQSRLIYECCFQRFEI